MKKIVLLVLAILFVPVICFGAHAEWTPPTTNTDGTALTDLAGFNFYNVTSTRTKVNASLISPSVCTGTPSVCSYTIPGTVPDGNKYVVTAVDTSGNESADSNQAVAAISPSSPAGLIIKFP